MAIDKSLISGSTSMLLLSLLAEKEMYGYEMIEALEKMSKNVFSFKSGTLYPVLHALEKKGYLVSNEKQAPNGRMRKYYAITSKGNKILDEKKIEWNTFTSAVNKVLEGGADNEEIYGY